MNTWLTSILRTRVAVDATALEIAEAMSRTLVAIDDALAPTLGHQAVTLLFRRSFLASARAHPWMGPLNEGNHARLGLESVTMLFSQQPSRDAAVAGTAFLQTFYDFLVALLGVSLSERLLRPVWANKWVVGRVATNHR